MSSVSSQAAASEASSANSSGQDEGGASQQGEPSDAASHGSGSNPADSRQPQQEPVGKQPVASSQGKDAYQTDPVPSGKPQPVEPEDTQVNEQKKLTCTLSIRCDTILDNMDHFNQDKLSVLPADGVVFPAQTVEFSEGESVFDVLLRVTRYNRIHMEFRPTPIYNSNYICGIQNLYEFDCGELSGWMYAVNGWYPNYGCSRYLLKDGDSIEWNFTCDLGRDLGQNWVDGNAQKEGA